MSTTRYRSVNITTNTTTSVKSGAGYIGSLTINTAGASSNVITVYDNTTATSPVLATIDGDAAAGSTFLRDVKFDTGLTIKTATGTCADITVTYE